MFDVLEATGNLNIHQRIYYLNLHARVNRIFHSVTCLTQLIEYLVTLSSASGKIHELTVLRAQGRQGRIMSGARTRCT